MSAEWSRPQVQRRELGPMIHDIGHTVYDMAEELVIDQGMPTEPDTLERLAVFGQDCLTVGHFAVTEVLADKKHQHIGELLTKHHGRIGGPMLTFNMNLSDVLREGTSTGIVSPLQLYRTMRIYEAMLSGSEVTVEPIEDIAERIREPGFQAMLHQLAAGHNGSLGANSTLWVNLGRPELGDKTDPQTFHLIYNLGLEGSFEHDEDGRVVSFTDGFLRHQNEAKKKERNIHKRGGITHSGGCPVRHADFPVIGERAQAYLEALGRPDAQPQKLGESLITRASRFVCAALVSSKGVEF